MKWVRCVIQFHLREKTLSAVTPARSGDRRVEALAEPRRLFSGCPIFTFEQGNPMTKTVLIAAVLALALAGCSDSNKAAADKAAADAKAAAEKAAAATKEAAD